MNKQASLIKMMTIDYIAFMGWVLPVTLWGMYGILVFIGDVKTNDQSLSVMFMGITVLALVVFVWRIRVIHSIFTDGMEAEAIIKRVTFFRDRGRVDYEYTFQGQKYISGNAVHRVKRTQALQAGEQVTLLVDRNNPKRALIRDLYC